MPAQVPVPEDPFNDYLIPGNLQKWERSYQSCSCLLQVHFQKVQMDHSEESNFQLFRDCLSTPLIEKSTTTPAKKPRKARAGRKNAIKPVIQAEEPNDTEELGEFIDVSSPRSSISQFEIRH